MSAITFGMGITATDLTKTLPSKAPPPGETWRTTKSILGLAVHHEGSPTPQGSNVFTIANYHVKTLGWGHIGYHWVVERSGLIYYTLGLEIAGYHAGRVEGEDITKFPGQDGQYYNDHWLAVCMVGNDPTPAQYKSVIAIGLAVKAAHEGLEIKGHGELPGKATSCPGPKTDMDYIRSEVAKHMDPKQKPTTGDDPFWQQFTTWKDGAVSVKGTADSFGNELVGTRNELIKQITAVEGVLAMMRLRLASIRKLTGG